MDAQQYYEAQTVLFKKECDQLLAEVQKSVNQELNRFLVGEIARAKQNMLAHTEEHWRAFLRQMAEAERYRQSPVIARRGIPDSLEKAAKQKLENDLENTRKFLQGFIERCRRQMR